MQMNDGYEDVMIKVITGAREIARRGEDNYSVNHLFIQYNRVRAMCIPSYTRYTTLQQIIDKVGNDELEISFP